MAVEQIFRVRVGFTHPKNLDVVVTALDSTMTEKGIINWSIMTGNPACFPYIEAEFLTRYEAANFEEKVKRIIKANKGTIDP